MTTKSNCVHCGTEITAITHRINDGFCMPCCDPFPGIKGTKHLLAPLTEAEVDAELAARRNPAAEQQAKKTQKSRQSHPQ